MSAAPRPRLVIPAVTLVLGWIVGSLTPWHTACESGRVTPTNVPAAATSLPENKELVGFSNGSREPRSALAIALQTPKGLQRRRNLIDAIGRLSVDEIPGMVETAHRLSSADREEVLALLGAHWAELDLLAAMSFATSARDLVDSRGIGCSVMAVWVERDQKAAIAWGLGQPKNEMRKTVLDTLCSALANRSFAEARAVFDQLTDPAERSRYAETLVGAAKPGEEPAALAIGLPTGPDRDRIIRRALLAWAAEDEKAAFAWADQLPPSPQGNLALSVVAGQWSEHDPRAAVEAWTNRTTAKSPTEGDWTLAQLVSQWARSEPQEAVAWARNLSSGAGKDTVLQLLAGRVAENDPSAAIDLISQVDDPRAQQGARRLVADSWCRTQPEAAARWVMSWGTSVQQTDSLWMIVQNWAGSDSPAAIRWAETLPSSPQRDAVASGLANRLVNEKPAAAATWASSVVDLGKRREAVEAVAWGWLRSNGKAARAWIETRPELTPEVKARLLSK